MNILLLTILGTAIGIGLTVILAACAPARPRLADGLRLPHEPARQAFATHPSNLIQAAGAPAAAVLAALGLPRCRVRVDLTALGRSTTAHLAQQAGLALTGLTAGPNYALALAAIGLDLPPIIPIAATALLTVAGYLLPSRLVRTEAAKLREQVRYATSALLDLVAVMLAAGAGQEEAFSLAANSGHGPGHDHLRAALGAARTTRAPLWDELARLGERLAVTELTELAATSLLAGTEGAKIRETLATKAASLRARLLAAAEAKAASATERMGMPTVLLMIGFLIFTCYPALAQVMQSL